ncbi:MAG: hypothetical protein V1875_04930 [Candidatus Altiarchaeota archaeon]
MQAAAFAVLASLAFLGGCLGGSGGMKYFESVYQYPDCAEGVCFDEVLALEDGLVYLKSDEFDAAAKASFCVADPDRLKGIFSGLDADFGESGLIECRGCPAYHLFYNDGGRTMYVSAPKGQSSLAEDYFPNAKGVCSSSTDAGLVHFIRGRGKEFIDYHIFSNDVVVWERFGLRDAELLDSRVYRQGGIFSNVSALIDEGFFSSGTQDNCPKGVLFYGFIEASIGGRHAEYFTCGDDTAPGRVFSALDSMLGDDL